MRHSGVVRHGFRSGLALIIAGVTLAAAGVAAPAAARPADPGAAIVGAGSADAIAGSYIVVLKDGVDTSAAAALHTRYAARVSHVYSATITGFAAELTEPEARRLTTDSRVAYVAQNTRVRALDIQTDPPSWGLDRVDQRNQPYDQMYMYSTTASNVNAYIIDTGIRITHQQFGGRARHGRDTIDNDNDSSDCHGHGTHVAGTVGSALYGVAKGVTLWGVRVLNCEGFGTDAQVIAGIDWVTANAVKPAVANMSLGGDFSLPLNQATQRSIAAGITHAIAAGNANSDACQDSPGSTPEAITVGASTIGDARAPFSNVGTCVDIFAPGLGIISTSNLSDTAVRGLSGTSMASPHVAGAAALYLATHPTATPQQVRDAIVTAATPDKLTQIGPGSPNRLLFTDHGVTLPPPPPGCFARTNDTDIQIPDAGRPVGSQIRIGQCAGNASSRLKVEVHIKHTFRGDLKIDLVAPDGTVYPLKASSGSDGGDNVDATYTVNASSEPADGAWLLSVQDRSEGDTGFLDRWRLAVKG
ncbi:MAG TPA: S8 family serine peptidase [Pilimelia sp.]|nr:S8 family serine peptidase [Pilimelia sp.]